MGFKRDIWDRATSKKFRSPLGLKTMQGGFDGYYATRRCKYITSNPEEEYH